MGYRARCKKCGEDVRGDSVDDLRSSQKNHRSLSGRDHRFMEKRTETRSEFDELERRRLA